MMRMLVLTVVVSGAFGCAGEEGEEAFIEVRADVPAAELVPGTKVVSDPVRPEGALVMHVVLAGKRADGSVVTLGAARFAGAGASKDHVMIAAGAEVDVIDGARLAMSLGEGELSWGAVELEGNERAVFGLAVRRVMGAGGERMFLEGTGTIGEEDVEVAGVALLASETDEVIAAVLPGTAEGDAWGLVVVNGVAEVVLPEGCVGGELVPAWTLGAVAAADDVDLTTARRELVTVDAAGLALPGAHHFLREHAE